MLLFLVSPCILVAVQSCMEWIPIKKNPHSSPWFSAVCPAAITHGNHFFHLYQQNKFSESKVKFRQSSNRCKRVLEAAKRSYITKTKEPITSQKPGSLDFWWIANIVFKEGKSAIPPLFSGLEVLFSTSYKAKLIAKDFSKNSNLDNLGISLSVFLSRTKLKLYNISITPKMVKKVIKNLDSSKIWSWLYSSGGSKELWAWTFLHISWTLQ